ncbi:MAG: hypothetical protein ACHQNV_06220, partial [Vicinamibacteria bacterium]
MRLPFASPALALVALLATGQETPPAKPAPSPDAREPPCSASEYRQFDFWLGDWDVYENGKAAGTNRVTREF